MRYDRSKWLIYSIALQQETFALWTVVIILDVLISLPLMLIFRY